MSSVNWFALTLFLYLVRKHFTICFPYFQPFTFLYNLIVVLRYTSVFAGLYPRGFCYIVAALNCSDVYCLRNFCVASVHCTGSARLCVFDNFKIPLIKEFHFLLLVRCLMFNICCCLRDVLNI